MTICVNSLLMLWVICLSCGPVYNIIGDAGVFALMFGIVVLLGKISFNKKVMPWVFAFMIFIIIKALSINNGEALSEFHSAYAVVNTALKLIVFVLFIQIIYPILERNNGFRKRLSNVFVTCFSLSIAISVVILLMYGRNVYRGQLGSGGIFLAPQGYINYSMLFIVMLAYLLISERKNRIRNSILLLLNIVYLFLANYTTQMIFAFLGIGLVIVIGLRVRPICKALILGMFLLVFVVCVPFLPSIIQWISSTFFADNITVNSRLNEIVLLLQGQNLADSDLMIRVNLFNMSLHSFINDPFLGVPFFRYNTIATGMVVGGHAEWFDDLARYGILGMVLFIELIVNSIKFMFNKATYEINSLEKGKKTFDGIKKVYFVFIAMYGLCNPIIRYMEFAFLFLISETIFCEVNFCEKKSIKRFINLDFSIYNT